VIVRFRVPGAGKAKVTHHVPHGPGPDEELVCAATIRVRPSEKAAPHAAIVEREGWRVRHTATLPVRRLFVCVESLRYSCLGERVIPRPFFLVTAVGTGSTGGIFVGRVEHEPVDAGERIQLALWRGVGARRISDIGTTHHYSPDDAFAHRHRVGAAGLNPQRCSSANRLGYGGRAAETRAARRT
jgi:hypothetical protein